MSHSGAGTKVSERDVPRLHADASRVKVAGRWVVATADNRVHSFEEADGAVSEVGERILELVDGVRTVGQITAAVVEEFEVDEATAASETSEFIGVLVSRQVLVLR